MSTPLLRTKLQIPPARPEVVARPRLMQRLDDGLYGKLILVSAPAGFGKTTLLSTWAYALQKASPPLHVAWLSLGEDDNDPARFHAYLTAGLRQIDESLGEGSLPTLPSAKSLQLEPHLTTLLNQINARPEPLVLVLDDYHLVTAEAIHRAIAFFAEHLPHNMHLVVATRADPPLPIARLRGRGQLTELRQMDLRFTPEEAAEFLNEAMGLDLEANDVAALTLRTEGWVAGLQMAALSLLGRGHREDASARSRFIQSFTGSHSFILDYLMEEVLSQQPVEIQEFLLRTSILKQMTAPLCDLLVPLAASGPPPPILGHQSPSQQVLERLEAANLFIIPLDEERRWYRYHHLFSELLRQRLQQAQPEAIPELHRRACEWFARNGPADAAIEHALLAGDLERAVHLIEQAAEETWMRSEVATFTGWVEALPAEVVRNHPVLGVYLAMAWLMDGRPFNSVEEGLRELTTDDSSGTASGAMVVFQALVAAYRGDASQSAALSRQALNLLPKENLFLRSFVAGILGLGCLYGCDFDTAIHALKEAAQVGEQAGNAMNAVLAHCHLGEIAIAQGRLHEAEPHFEKALQLAMEGRGQPLPIAGMALIGLGQLETERYELDAATRHVAKGIELVSRWGEAGLIRGYAVLARLKQASGDLESARQLLARAKKIALSFDVMEVDDVLIGLCQAELWTTEGNLAAAAHWAEERGLMQALDAVDRDIVEDNLSPALRHIREREYHTLAKLLIAQEKPDEAARLLERLSHLAKRDGLVSRQVATAALHAVALHALGRTDEALQRLRLALSLAQPRGFVYRFIDAGPLVEDLLRHAASRGIEPAYVARLLAVFVGTRGIPQSSCAGEPPPTIRKQPLVEPLSERELDVLRTLPTGLSNREIGEQLFIATSTVRSHLKSIYGKLNVHRRWDAVERAHELGLI
jgi:LuxR family maltose regulon positive regulatory protein